MSTDWDVTNHGTIFTFLPLSDAAKEWGKEHFPDDCMMFAWAYVVEWRYAEAIADDRQRLHHPVSC